MIRPEQFDSIYKIVNNICELKNILKGCEV